ncbi:MAG TPA: YiiX/YebB-like N1pC/P60 family cysteine hydrolase [Planctomycetota bacterium]|nr:YiiX/YebB-like N1pC/P60 family cysteine hydrolase [Planctomycetota bacterium]
MAVSTAEDMGVSAIGGKTGPSFDPADAADPAAGAPAPAEATAGATTGATTSPTGRGPAAPPARPGGAPASRMDVMANLTRGESLGDQGKADGLQALGEPVRHFATWFNFGIGEARKADDPPRLTGADAKALLPQLKPGDTILCGNHGGLTHSLVYVGDGKVIHAMASEETVRTTAQRIGDTIEAPFVNVAEALGLKKKKTGVIEEDLSEFFDRFERDTYVVMRDPNLTPEAAQKGVDKAKSLLGKGYDYDFVPGNDKYYCTEVAAEFYKAALGDEGPRFTSRVPDHQVPVLFQRTNVLDPLDIFASPDLKPVAHSKSAEAKWADGLDR